MLKAVVPRRRPRRRPALRRPRPGPSATATGSAWSAPTAPARPPCCASSPASCARPPAPSPTAPAPGSATSPQQIARPGRHGRRVPDRRPRRTRRGHRRRCATSRTGWPPATTCSTSTARCRNAGPRCRAGPPRPGSPRSASGSTSPTSTTSRPLADVSGGEQARLLLARALLDAPRRAAARRADQPPRRRGRGLAAAVAAPASPAASSRSATTGRSSTPRSPASSSSTASTTQPQDYPGGGYTAYRAREAAALGAAAARLRGPGEGPAALGGRHRADQGAGPRRRAHRPLRRRPRRTCAGSPGWWRARRRSANGGCSGRWTRYGGSPGRRPGRR